MNGQGPVRPSFLRRPGPRVLKQKPRGLPRAPASVPTSRLSPSISITAGRGWKGAGVLLCDGPKVRLSTSSLWNCSPDPWQDGILTPLFIFSFFLFFYPNQQLGAASGAVVCCRADGGHFRPVLASKGAEHHGCVLGAQSCPLPAVQGWWPQGLLPLNILGPCHPAHPAPARSAGCGCRERAQGKGGRGSFGGGGEGKRQKGRRWGITDLEPTLPAARRLSLLHPLRWQRAQHTADAP